MRFGPGLWPAVGVASVALNLALGSGWSAALLMAAGNVGEGLLGAWLLRPPGFRPALDRQRDVLRFLLLGVCVAPLPAGALGGLGWQICQGGTGILLAHAVTWWLHDAAGILVAAPVVLTWPGRGTASLAAGRRGEAVACAAWLLLTSAVAFLPSPAAGAAHGLAFLPFPALVWAALRFGPAGGARAAFATVALAAWFTGEAQAAAAPAASILTIWVFVAMASLTSLFGAALVAERDAAVKERERGERRLRAVVDLVPHWIFVKDRDGRFLLANRSIAEAYGTTVEGLTGARGADFLPHDQVLGFLEDDQRVISSGRELVRDPEVFVDAFGRRRFFHTTKVPFDADPGGPGSAVLGCAIDVTEWRQAQATLRRAERLAAVADLAEGMAHEIRNPLFAFSAGLEALLETSPPGGDSEEALIVASMRAQIVRLTRLIDQFQAIAGTSHPKREPCCLGTLVEEVAADAAANAAERRVRLELGERDPSARPPAEAGRVKQALQSLVDNALRHAPEGTAVEISVTRSLDEAVCRVRDHGPGFEAGDERRVVEPFFTRERGRFGLGLTLAHSVAATHGGRLVIENAAPRGGLVSLVLPLHPPPPSAEVD